MFRRRLDDSTRTGTTTCRSSSAAVTSSRRLRQRVTRPRTSRRSASTTSNLTYRSFATSANQPAGPVQVTIFNSPTIVKRAVMNTALYVQDTYSIGRLTVIAGIRWERVEGYIPAQAHASSRVLPDRHDDHRAQRHPEHRRHADQYVVPDTFARGAERAAVEELGAARCSATYDLTGRRQDRRKSILAGKYLDQIGTGTPGPNPNGTVSQRYTWNDLNGDLFFQPGNATWDGSKYVGGEFGALANNGTTIPNPNPFDTPERGPTATSSRPASTTSSSRACGQRDLHLRKPSAHPTTTSTWRSISGRRHMFRCRSSIRAGTASPATRRRTITAFNLAPNVTHQPAQCQRRPARPRGTTASS